MKSLLKLVPSLPALALILAGAAHAQSAGPSFSDLDVDGSGEIEMDEFHHDADQGIDDLSARTDSEYDGFGDNAESLESTDDRLLEETMFKRYDTNVSGGLDEDEYREYQDHVSSRLRDF